MKYVKIIYNSYLWAMTIAVLCFKNEWLQMRVNTGLIFFGIMILMTIVSGFIFRKKKTGYNWVFTVCNLAVCTVTGLIVYGFDRMKVVPAALLREGIHQTSIPFSTINTILLAVTVTGFAVVFIYDLLKKKSK